MLSNVNSYLFVENGFGATQGGDSAAIGDATVKVEWLSCVEMRDEAAKELVVLLCHLFVMFGGKRAVLHTIDNLRVRNGARNKKSRRRKKRRRAYLTSHLATQACLEHITILLRHHTEVALERQQVRYL